MNLHRRFVHVGFALVCSAAALFATSARAGALEECMTAGDRGAVTTCLLNEDRKANEELNAAEAAAAISPIVSFLTRRPTVSAAIITGDTSPLMIRRMIDSISSWKISRCSIVRCSASWGVMASLGTPYRLSAAACGPGSS